MASEERPNRGKEGRKSEERRGEVKSGRADRLTERGRQRVSDGASEQDTNKERKRERGEGKGGRKGGHCPGAGGASQLFRGSSSCCCLLAFETMMRARLKQTGSAHVRLALYTYAPQFDPIYRDSPWDVPAFASNSMYQVGCACGVSSIFARWKGRLLKVHAYLNCFEQCLHAYNSLGYLRSMYCFVRNLS